MLAKFTWDHLLRTILAFLESTNWILWRAWGDKLLFEIKEAGPTKTEVRVYAIPNLLRYKVRKNERALDWEDVEKAHRSIARVEPDGLGLAGKQLSDYPVYQDFVCVCGSKV